MDTNVGGDVTEESCASSVAVLHAADIDSEGSRGFGTDDAVGEGVAGGEEIVGYGCCLEEKTA